MPKPMIFLLNTHTKTKTWSFLSSVCRNMYLCAYAPALLPALCHKLMATSYLLSHTKTWNWSFFHTSHTICQKISAGLSNPFSSPLLFKLLLVQDTLITPLDHCASLLHCILCATGKKTEVLNHCILYPN